MKAAIFYKPFDLRIEETKTPEPKTEEVLIKMKFASVCGTDLRLYTGELKSDYKENWILGHDGSGIIAKVGKRVTKFKKGDRVFPSFIFSCGKCAYCKMGKRMACEKGKNIGFETGGTFAEYLLAPANFVFKIPVSVSLEEAAMMEPIELALHTIELLMPRPKETIAILGQGPIGLVMTQIAKIFGLRVITTDIDEEKLTLSKKLGADFGINPEERNLKGEILKITKTGVDFTVETAGLQETVDQTSQITKPLGKIAILGEQEGLRGPVINQCDELTILTPVSGSGFGYRKALRLLAEKKIDVKNVISHIVKLEELPKIFQQVAKKKIEPLRILVRIYKVLSNFLNGSKILRVGRESPQPPTLLISTNF